MTQHHEDALSEERRREVGTEAAEHILGPNPVVGVRGQDLFQTASMLVKQAVKQPHLVLAHGLMFAAEAARIVGGSSGLASDAKDRRFQELLGGQREFILSTSGHIQSILNPPGNAKATFFSNDEQQASAQAWYAGATKHSGSWWEHWKAWLLAHSGSQKAAPASLGNSMYKPLVEAPGMYVYE